jgi:hypothetical protein
MPLAWVVVGDLPLADDADLGARVRLARTFEEAAGDVVVLDWMAASYLAPGVKPRPHAVVVRAHEREHQFPSLVLVPPSYSRDRARPSGMDMIASEGRLVGDALLVARCAGLSINTVAIEALAFENYARNEHVDVLAAAQEFFRAATKGISPATRARMEDT